MPSPTVEPSDAMSKKPFVSASPMQPPPSNQKLQQAPRRDGDRSDTETSIAVIHSDVASGGESCSADSLDDESEEEEEGLPEKAWVRRRIKKLEKRADFKESDAGMGLYRARLQVLYGQDEE